MSDKKWRGRLYKALERTANAAELGTTEAIVEDLQTVIEAFTVNYLNDNNLAREFVDTAYGIVPLTADQVAGRMEARAAGALFGVLGFFGRGTGGRRLPRKAKETITEDDLRELNLAVGTTDTWESYSEDEQDTIAATFEGVEGPGFTLGTRPYSREVDRREASLRDLTLGGVVLTDEQLNRRAEAAAGDPTRFSREAGTAAPDMTVEGGRVVSRRPGFGAIPDDTTTTQAVEALEGRTGPDGKRKSPRTIAKEQEQAQAAAQSKRDLAQLRAEIKADLQQQPLEGGIPAADIPAPETAAAVPPTTQRAEEDFVKAVVDTKAPDPRSLEVQMDLERALSMVMQEILDKRIASGDVLSREESAEAEQYQNLQREVAIEKYLQAVDRTRKSGKKVKYEEGTGLLAIEETEKGNPRGTAAAIDEILSEAGLERSDIGAEGAKDGVELEKALVEWLGEDTLADWRMLEEEEYTSFHSEAVEENALRKADAILERVAEGGGTNLVYSTLLDKWGTLDLEAIALRARIQDEIEKRRKARLEGQVRQTKEASTAARELALQKSKSVGRRRRGKIAVAFKTPEERRQLREKRELARKGQPELGLAPTQKVTDRGEQKRRRPVAKSQVPKSSLLRAAKTLREAGNTEDAKRLEALAEGAPEEGVVTTTERIAELVASVEEAALQEPEYRTLKGEIEERAEAADVLSAEEWLKTEAAYELIREAFSLGDKGNNFPRGSVKKFATTRKFIDWIKTYYPQGKDAYDPEFYAESDLGQFELKLKQEIAKRRIAKEKKIWGKPNWEEQISQTELDKEVENIKFVSPAGTYVREAKPPRRAILFYKRHEKKASLEKLTSKQEKAYRRRGGMGYQEIAKGDVVLDEEGNPVLESRIPKTHEIVQLPERYIGYDQADQVIAEQFVDDERNFEIRAKLTALLSSAQARTITDEKTGEKRQGTKDDIPIEKLAEVLKEYGIRSSFVGVVRKTRGRAKEVYADTITMEGWVPSEERNIEGWYQASTPNVADELVVLGELSNLYFELLKKFGDSKDAQAVAWSTAYNETVGRIEDNTRILRAQLEPLIKEQFPDIEAKELTKKLKEENAIFSLRLGAFDKIIDGQYKVGETKDGQDIRVTGKGWLTNPENRGKSIPFGEPATAGQVYDSIRNSASRGERALQAVGYSESRENFLNRFSHSPRDPRAITPGAKVQLLPEAWVPAFARKNSRVLNLSLDIQKTERKINNSLARRDQFPKKSAGYKLATEIQNELNDELSRLKVEVQTAMNEIINKSFNVIGKRGKENLILEPVGGGQRFEVSLDNVALVEYSRVGLNKLEAHQIYAVERDAEIVATYWKRSPVRVERETESRGQNVRRIIKEVDKGIEETIVARAETNVNVVKAELERKLEEAKTDAEKRNAKARANARIKRIRDEAVTDIRQQVRRDETRYYKIMEALSEAIIGGRYLLSLPKELAGQVAGGKLTRKEATEKYLEQVKKEIAKEGRWKRRARLKQEFIEDNDLDLVESLLTPEGTWLPEEEAKATWTIKDKNGKSLLDKLQVKLPTSKTVEEKVPSKMGGFRTVEKVVKFQEADIYPWLKARYSELMFAIEDRLPVAERQPRFEGGQMPPIWDTKPWKFVKSSELIPKDAYETMLRSTQKEHQVLIREKRIFATGEPIAEIPPEKILGTGEELTLQTARYPTYLYGLGIEREKDWNITGEFLNAAPINRWKNAYGLMIDEVSFEYKTNDGTVEIRTIFEVVNPYTPENFQTFNTLKKAQKVFESETYYKKLGNRGMRKLTPFPSELGFKPTFPRAAQSYIRPGTPDRIWMPKRGDRPATTVDILKGEDTVIQGRVAVQQIEPGGATGEGVAGVRKSKIVVTGQKRQDVTYPILQQKRVDDAETLEAQAKEKQKASKTLQEKIGKLSSRLAALSQPVGRTQETEGEIKSRLREVVENQIEAKEIDKDLWRKVAKSNAIGVTRVWNIADDITIAQKAALRKRNEPIEEAGRLGLREVREQRARDSYIAQRVEQLRKEEEAKPTRRRLERKPTEKQQEKADDLRRRIAELENQAFDLGIDLERALPQGAKFSLVLESEYSEDGTIHFLFAEKGEKGSSRSEIVDALGEAFGRQVFQFLRVVQTESDLPIDIRLSRIAYKSPIRGVSYNNQIWLVADNLPVDRAVAVGLHEIGAHGFQAVMGKRFYQKLMKQIAVLVNTDEHFGAIYNRLKTEMPTTSEPLLLEETFAYAVETQAMQDTPFWRAVVDAILYALAKLKLWVNPKKVGAKEILIFAKAAARKHAVTAQSGDAVYTANFLNTFLYSGRFEHSSAASDHESSLASGLREDSEFAHDTGFHDKWLERDVPPALHWWENFIVMRDISKSPSDVKYKHPSQIRRKRKLFGREYEIYVAPEFVKRIQDFKNILKLMERSVEVRGGNINRLISPSVWYGRYKNRVEHFRGKFEEVFVDPLQDFMFRKKVSGDDLFWWAYAQHAPYRNEAKEGRAKSQKLPNASGIFTNKADRDAWFDSLKPGDVVKSHNYLYALGEGGIIDEIEKRLGKNSEALNNLQKAYGQLRKINQYNLDLQLESGLLNFDALTPAQRKVYEHKGYRETYVPLMGQDYIVEDEFFEKPLGVSRVNVSGPESKAAHGRADVPENIWAHSIANVYHTIDRVEKNTVIISFANLVLDNQENFKDFAVVTKLKDAEKHIDPATGRNFLGMPAKQQTDPDFNIHFKQNGYEWVIIVKDKRIGQAFNRTNMTDSGVFLQLTSQLNRYYSAIHTSMYPEFIVGNFTRDLGTALGHLEGLKETMEDFQTQERMTRNILKNLKGAGIGLKQNIRDKRTDTYWSNRANQFGEAGGRINFFGFKNVRDFERKWNSFIADTSTGAFKRHFKMVTDFVSDYNAVVENVIRLATFDEAVKVLIENGKTEVDAHLIAGDVVRNLTVNFSEKGEMSSGLNALYLFFNASVQGSARMFQALFARPGKFGKRFTRVQKLAGSIMLMGFVQSILNSTLGGDDEDGRNRYEQIDLTNRSRQGYFYLPGFDVFMKVPWAYGYNFFWAAGDTAGALMMNQTNPGRAAMHLLSTAAESFMPFSFGAGDNLFKNTLSAVTPTFADPLVDLAINESYFGQPIYKENLWGSSDPPSERYWGSTGPIFKGISRGMNALTGGSRVEAGFFSIPPDIWEFIWETASGGVGRFAENTTDLVLTIGPGAISHKDTGMVKWNKVPFVRRFVHDEGATNARNIYDQFMYYERAVSAAVGLETGIKEIYGVGEQYNNFKESPDWKLYQERNRKKVAVRRLTKLQTEVRKLQANRQMTSQEIQDAIDELKTKQRAIRIKFINEMEALFGG
jgi:hypothetical protein